MRISSVRFVNMDNITLNHDPVKRELDRTLCQGCLSGERNLAPLRHNAELFLYLLGQPHVLQDSTYMGILLCWECQALLRNVHKFQLRIRNAHFILQQTLCQLDNNTPTKLSSQNLSSLQVKHQYEETSSEISVVNSFQSSASTHKEKEKEKISIEKNEVKIINVECKEENLDSDQDMFDYELPIEAIQFEDTKIEIDKKIKIEAKVNSKSRALSMPLKKFKKKAKITLNKDMDLDNLSIYYENVFVSEKEILDIINRDQKRFEKKKLKYKCKKCKCGFNLKVDMMRHETFLHKKQISNQTVGPQECKECQTVVPSWQELVTHWQEHNFVFKCLLCGLECRRNGDIKRHLETHSKVYSCRECHATFHTQKEFSVHYRELHRRLVCDSCGQRFMHKQSILKHIRRHHMPAKCEDCKTTYSRYEGLLRHNNLVHPERVKKRTVEKTELMYCVECDIQFPNVMKYRRHLGTAVVHKPPKRISVPCPACDKVFTRKLYMKNHYMLLHLRKTNYQCDLCKKYFSSAYAMRKHKWAVHDKMPKPKTKVCDICGRAFHTNRILMNHRRTHTGERPFSCPHCAAAFAQRTALTTHVRTQHTGKPTPAPNAGRYYRHGHE